MTHAQEAPHAQGTEEAQDLVEGVQEGQVLLTTGPLDYRPAVVRPYRDPSMTTVRRTGIPGVVVIESPGQPGATGSVKIAVSVRAIASIQPDFGVIAAVRVKLTTGDSFYANGDIEAFLAALAAALDPETHPCS